ncbi:MAG: N-acetylmuramoyl-L-alanine amidase [Oscillospiraceae bacterium]|nr:N-acetylmuramoyl-L-alanine amidase [Oscillospiraceae bacterium]
MSNIWYLSPSNQSANVGIDGYGTEKAQMNLLVDAITPHLDRAGVSFHRGDPDITIQKRAAESNEMGACFHLALHSNAGGKGKAWGPVALYYSDTGKEFAQKLVTSLLALGQQNNRASNLTQNKALYELRKTTAPACLLEVDFHDSSVGVAFLTKRRADIAEAIARCIIEADGKEFVPVTAGESAELCLNWGLLDLSDGRGWNVAMTRKEAAVLAVRLKKLIEKEVKKG